MAQPLLDSTQLDSTVLVSLVPSGGTAGQVLTIVSGTPAWQTPSAAGTGSVTSVAVSSTAGTLTITGSPITTSGTINVDLPTTGVLAGSYANPNITVDSFGRVTNIATGAVGGSVTSVGLSSPSSSITVGGTTSPITTTGAFTIDLPATGVAAGIYNYANFSVDTYGRITAASPNTPVTSFNTRTGTVTLNLTDVTTALGFTPYNATNPANYISANQTITLSGDVSGSGTTAIATTLATQSGVTAGTYAGSYGSTTLLIPYVTVNAKGLVTGIGLTTKTRPLFSSTVQGEVPPSPGGTSYFLRGDGTWAVPAYSTGSVSSVAAQSGSTALTIAGSPITTSGTLTFTLGAELEALAGLSSTGFVQRTGTATYSVASLTGNQITNALGYTPVQNSLTINVAGGALAGGGPLTSTVEISLAAFSGNAPGYVPINTPANTGTQFLRDDATWHSLVSSVAASGGTTGLTFSGSPITGSGTLTLSGTLAIASGGTGQTTASAALNALLPTQTGNSGSFLTTNGTTASWTVSNAGAVTGTFTGTLTGMTTTVTGTVRYTIVGGLCCLYLPSAITGISNSVAMTMTGLPAAVTPITSQNVPSINMEDAAVSKVGSATIQSNSVISFALYAVSGTNITSSTNGFSSSALTKGLYAGWRVVYSLV